ncbi:MAG: TlpA disulfide reductase family protein [Dehalococcoidales bacterium]|nr:TlpA disulfide reductase family protein [Dehalococcoidales bacterium]
MRKSVIIGMIAMFALFLLSSCGGKATPAINAPTPATSNLTQLATPNPQNEMIGKPAPDFRLNDMDGESVLLSDLRGKAVLLNFWATWCPFCQAERPTIQQIYQEWQNKGLVVLTIDIINSRSTETPANLADFMQKNNYSFPVLLDETQIVTKSYFIRQTPTNFLIDKDGIIREITLGAYPSKAAMEDSLNKILPK